MMSWMMPAMKSSTLACVVGLGVGVGVGVGVGLGLGLGLVEGGGVTQLQ